jgi:general nucleoside transport system permease protein
MSIIIGALQNAIPAGGVLAFAAMGGLLCERVGILNLGLEGLMAMGAISAIIGALATNSALDGLLLALLVGCGLGILFAAATVLVQVNQALCSLALTIGGIGVANAIGRNFTGLPIPAVFQPLPIPLLRNVPLLGPILFEQNVLVYAVYLGLPCLLHLLYFNTRHGLDVRAVGESPSAADASGVAVTRIRFFYVVAGCAMAAASGAYLTLAYIPSWSEGMTSGRGWIAIALVIVSRHRPLNIAAGALIFGFITSLGFTSQAQNWGLSPTLLSILPYVATIASMLLPARLLRTSRRSAPPAALGRPYVREGQFW